MFAAKSHFTLVTFRSQVLAFCCALFFALSCTSASQAVPYYWNTGTGTFATGANWSDNAVAGGTTGVVPGVGDTATFNQSSVNGAETITIAAQSVQGVTFANTGTTSLTGGTLGVGSSGLTANSGSGAVTIVSGLTVNGSQSWANNSGNLFLVSSNVGGSGSPTLTNASTGTGAVQFGGIIAAGVTKIVQNSATSQLNLRNPSNAFGNLEIWKGTVGIGNGGAAYGNGAVTIGNSAGGSDAATLLQTNNGNDVYNRAIVLASNTTGTLTIAQADDTSGTWGVTFSGGVTGNNSLVIENRGGNETITFSTGSLNNAGSITHLGTSGATGTATINSVIGNSVTGLTQNAATSTLRLNGANTFSGPTIATAGTLELGNVNALQNSKLNVSGAGTVTFNVAGTNTYTLGGLTGNGSLNAGANSLNVAGIAPGNSAGLVSVTANTVTLSGTSTFEINGATRGTQYDAFDTTGALAYGGTLNVQFNFNPVLNQTFDLFNFATQSGAFSSVNVTFQQPEYSASFNNLTGVLTITAAPLPAPEPRCLLITSLGGLLLVCRRKRA